MWNIDKLSEPYTYLAHEDQKYIKFKTDDTFNGLEIDVSSFDMTKDGVIFIPNSGFPRYEGDDFTGVVTNDTDVYKVSLPMDEVASRLVNGNAIHIIED